VLVSPVDARVHTFGTIEGGRFVQAEGQRCPVDMLLGVGDLRVPGASPADAARFEGGGWAILYLSPKDYHRVHTPAEGTVARYRYLPGQFWPVFPAATKKVPDLFARNERLVFFLDTPFGHIAQVMVGAFGVSRMTTVVGPLVTNTGGGGEDVRLSPALPIGRAAELGRFNMGSTVILLTEPGRLRWTLTAGAPVKLGQPIARRA
jgi:phosphatidylserine decarboxylase